MVCQRLHGGHCAANQSQPRFRALDHFARNLRPDMLHLPGCKLDRGQREPSTYTCPRFVHGKLEEDMNLLIHKSICSDLLVFLSAQLQQIWRATLLLRPEHSHADGL
ncbi:hypothetical protein WJX77_008223 [Trebouxia sp. C0004]